MFVCFAIAMSKNNENQDTSEQLTELVKSYLDYKKEKNVVANRFKVKSPEAA